MTITIGLRYLPFACNDLRSGRLAIPDVKIINTVIGSSIPDTDIIVLFSITKKSETENHKPIPRSKHKPY